MAIRKKLTHDMRTREKIRTSQLINRLENHVLGKIELSATQVTAALGLMKKTLPDLTAVEHSGEIATNNASELSDSVLADIATGSSTGASEQADSEKVTH